MGFCYAKSAYLLLDGKCEKAMFLFMKNTTNTDVGLLTGKASLVLLLVLWLKVPTGRRPRAVWLRLLRNVPLANTV